MSYLYAKIFMIIFLLIKSFASNRKYILLKEDDETWIKKHTIIKISV